MPILALVRHGESLWNLEDRFTGWVDVPLTAHGKEEARKGGLAMLRAELTFDLAYTSVLIRAHETLDVILAVTGYDLPVIRDEALNERHYGDLQGLSKDAMRKEYSDEQVHLWRRSYDIPPPNGESLKDTAARTLPFYERAILQDIRLDKDVLVVAHGNSNRAIVMMLDDLSEDEVPGLELPTGVPLIYDLEADGTVRDKRVLDF
ncbi:MAG: 2,3-bisphosphoglycerate-dependent phosphoglycerate mutase [Actinomycetota bacterium]|nr:2,3-bisphosphoglycerate-dependent phosphoglycerate mutase [Actinomycetota bacterium]